MSSVGSNHCHFATNSDRDKVFKILYFNARSILPKLDELKIITENSNPDVVCITETWLSQEISDGEMSIPGLFCSEGQKSPGWWGVGIR